MSDYEALVAAVETQQILAAYDEEIPGGLRTIFWQCFSSSCAIGPLPPRLDD